jgi:YidC/Oxa1 family membrane protein insertase
VAFRSGGTLASGGLDRTVRLWGADSGHWEQASVLNSTSYAVIEGKPYPNKDFLDDVTVRLVSQPVKLPSGVAVVHKYLLYNGPAKVRLLGHLESGGAETGQVSRYLNDLHLDTLTDYRYPSTPSWVPGFWTDLLILCTNFMHNFLWYLHVVIRDYGVCIMLLTILVRGAMYPLSRKQALASAKMQAVMKELQPEIKKLEEKYKNDPMALRQAKTELMMKRGANPLAMMGSCWMMFLQMPIFLGLYYALQESIHFRLASFLWMPNLAAPDMLIWWSTHIPEISKWESLRSSIIYLGPYFNLLPVVAIAFMIMQQKLLTPPPTDEQSAATMKMMPYMMVFMGFVFYKVAAGLCLYFISTSVWGLLERKVFLKKKVDAMSNPKAPPPKPAAPVAGKGKGKALKKPETNGRFQKVRDFWEKVLKEARKK